MIFAIRSLFLQVYNIFINIFYFIWKKVFAYCDILTKMALDTI